MENIHKDTPSLTKYSCWDLDGRIRADSSRWLWVWIKSNKKTAGHHGHFLRLPILVKMPFEKINAFLKNAFFQHLFWTPHLRKFLIFRRKRTSQLRSKTHSQNIISFDTDSTATLPALAVLKRKLEFSSTERICFCKKTKCLTALRNLSNRHALSGKFVILWKKFKVRNGHCRQIGHYQLAIQSYSNLDFECFEWKVFLPLYKWRQKKF